MKILTEKIIPNPNNARKYFSKIEELADDIKKNGLIQKITVRPVGDKYIIVQGERRFRALKLLHRNNLDCEVLDISEEKANNISLAENIQREDLSIVELANELKNRLKRTTQQKLAKEINKSQAFVSIILNVLKLPKSTQEHYFLNKLLTKEHAKELLELQKYLVHAFGFEELEVQSIINDFAWYAHIRNWDASQLKEAYMGNLTSRVTGFCFKKGDIYETWKHGNLVWKGENLVSEGAELKQHRYSTELLTKILVGSIKRCEHDWIVDDETKEKYCDKCMADYEILNNEIRGGRK